MPARLAQSPRLTAATRSPMSCTRGSWRDAIRRPWTWGSTSSARWSPSRSSSHHRPSGQRLARPRLAPPAVTQLRVRSALGERGWGPEPRGSVRELSVGKPLVNRTGVSGWREGVSGAPSPVAGPRLAPWLTPAIHVGMKSDDRKRGPTRKPGFPRPFVRGEAAFDAHVHRSVPCTASPCLPDGGGNARRWPPDGR